MKSLNWLMAVVLVACLSIPMQARAQTCTDATTCTNTAAGAASTSSVLTVALPVTTVGLLIWLIISVVNNHPAAMPNGRAAELYLRQNQVELQQDLAVGSGPMINDLAAAMELKADHVARFGKLMQANRGELSNLIAPTNLNPASAVQFIQSMSSIVSHDAVLSADFQAYVAHHAAQG